MKTGGGNGGGSGVTDTGPIFGPNVFWHNQNLIPLLNGWKYHLWVENDNFLGKLGVGNGCGSWGDYHR